MTDEQIKNIVREFVDKFTSVEFAQKYDDHGKPVSQMYMPSRDKKSSLELINWLTLSLQKYGEKVREELLIDLKKVLQKGYTPEVEEDIFTSLTKGEKEER